MTTFNPYPTDPDTLESWIGDFKALHERGARLILDVGGGMDEAADGKVSVARAEADAVGDDPDKAEMGVRKTPLRSGWRTRKEEWDDIEAHLIRGGWVSYAPEELGMVELDIDGGDVDALAETLGGMFPVLAEVPSVSGKRRLIVRYDYPHDAKGKRKRPRKTWTLPEGNGECLAVKATICDPKALLGAMDAHPHCESADLDVLRPGGASKRLDLEYQGEADESDLEGAVDHAIERIEDAGEGDRNNTVAAQAWRAGKAAGTAEGIDHASARERVAEAAESIAPDEADKARATAERQFNEGVASAEDEPFQVRSEEGAAAHLSALSAPEVVTDADRQAVEAWARREGRMPPWTPPVMQAGRIAPADHGLQELREGELGFVNDHEAAILLAVEQQLADVRIVKEGGPNAATEIIAWTDGEGFARVEWADFHPELADRLHNRRYTLKEWREEVGEDREGNKTYRTKREKLNRPTESSSSGFVKTTAGTMAGYQPWATRRAWWDANPYLIAHPEGMVTDLMSGAMRPVTRGDLILRRTPVTPSEWRGTPFEEWLTENVPGERDRLTLQCGLGTGCIGRQIGNTVLWLVGPGGSGKTGAVEAAMAAVGPDFTHPFKIHHLLLGRKAPGGFDATAARTALHEARMAVAEGEPSPEDNLDIGAYKSLSGGGSGEGRRIGGNSLALTRSPFTMVLTANRLPYASENDGALARRTHVVVFPRGRKAHEIDPAVNELLLTEPCQAAFLGFMLEGAHLVLRHGGMPPHTEQQEARAVFPERPLSAASTGRNRARDLRSGNASAAFTTALAEFVEERTMPDEDEVVWLDERADDACPKFIGALMDAGRQIADKMPSARLIVSPDSVVKALGRSHLTVGRRRGVKGSDRKHQCLTGRRVCNI